MLIPIKNTSKLKIGVSIFYLCVHVPVSCVCACMSVRGLQRPEEGAGFLGDGVAGGYELPWVLGTPPRSSAPAASALKPWLSYRLFSFSFPSYLSDSCSAFF